MMMIMIPMKKLLSATLTNIDRFSKEIAMYLFHVTWSTLLHCLVTFENLK